MIKTLCLTLMSGALAFSADITGIWAVKGEVASYPIELTCELAQKDADLSGTCKGNGRPDRAVTGHVTENTVDFGYDIEYDGNKMHVTYHGNVEDNKTMKGTVDASGNGGQFTASKQK